jgi:serine/threonine-protein kinase
MSRKNRYFIPSADRKLGDRYELLECLGDGSYGWVWKAQKLTDNTIVAVKIPKAQGSKNSELAEGENLLDQPAHPNVVSVFWMGRVPPEREWYAIEMEYFPSHTLARLLDEGEHGFTASYKKILDLYTQVLAGVNYLHSLGMSHGDIKPQNILVSGDLAKLTDFGNSLLPEEIYTRTRENGGTVLYSAPEFAGAIHKQRDSNRIFKGDIYSLGVLLYHLVTSRLPHDTLSQVIRHTPFPRPREINSSICPALEEYILRCLEFDPNRRWDTVETMLNEFTRVRRFQLDYHSVKLLPNQKVPHQDWSSQVIKLLENEEYAQAEVVAHAEFEDKKDIHAFRFMVSAAFKDERYYDCLKYIDSNPRVLDEQSPAARDLRRIALKAYLETRQLYKAEAVLEKCLLEDGDVPQLLLKKASILGAQAKYKEAADILIQLNRRSPQNPAVLKRLTLVFEQLRDIGKARAFLRAYSKLVPDDVWVQRKLDLYAQISSFN